MIYRFRDRILESAGWKTFFSVVIPIIAAVLSGTFIVEITTENGLDWISFYKSKSFYGLCILCVVTYVYNREAYFYERNIERFIDDDYCRAYMRSQCLPEAAQRYKVLIRDGDGGELTKAMREFEKIMQFERISK